MLTALPLVLAFSSPFAPVATLYGLEAIASDTLRLFVMREAESKQDQLSDPSRRLIARLGAILAEQGPTLVLTAPDAPARATATEVQKAMAMGEARPEPRLRAPEPKETPAQVNARLTELLESLRKDHTGEGIVLVAPGEVITALIGQLEQAKPLKGTPVEQLSGELKPASVTLIDWGQTPKPIVRMRNFNLGEPGIAR
jgi:broad specificity phosphatase PhoE